MPLSKRMEKLIVESRNLEEYSEYERVENHHIDAISATVLVSIPNPKLDQTRQ
jgi:hypothetical protein